MAILSSELFSKRGNLVTDNRPIISKVWVTDLQDPDKARNFTLSNLAKKRAGGVIVKGLLDTGATTTSISHSFAAKHDFQSVGQADVTSASHKALPTNLYTIGMFIGYDQLVKTIKGGKETLATKTGMLSPPAKIEALEFVGDDNFDVIVGMDVISHGLLLVSGYEDRVTVTF